MISLFTLFVCTLGITDIGDGESKEGEGISSIFKFELGSLVGGADLMISVTVRQGPLNPDLYVKAGSAPSVSDYGWRSTSSGPDLLTIASAELTSSTAYYILVQCDKEGKYMLTVSYSSEISLLEGVTIYNQVFPGIPTLYAFDAPPEAAEVSIVLIDSSGYMNMTVSKNLAPDINSGLPVKRDFLNNLVFFYSPVSRNDRFYASIESDVVSSYEIIATAGYSTAIELRSNKPIGGVVDTSRTRYYLWDIQTESDLLLQLTPFSGDPDLYVRANYKPDIGNNLFDFSVTGPGNNALRISAEDRERLGLPKGKYFVAVYGHTQASYTLLANDYLNGFVPIKKGVPQEGVVEFSSKIEYSYTVSSVNSLNMTVYLTPQTGDPNLYLRICRNRNVTFCSFTEEELANPEKYDIRTSQRRLGSEVIQFIHHPEDCDPDQRCMYVFAAYGNSLQDSRYIIRLTDSNDSEMILRDGDPVSMSIAYGEYLYFKYTVYNITASNLTFTLSPFSGNPDLYISQNYLPTNSHFEKQSINRLIEADQIRYEKGKDGQSLAGDYHISVYGSLVSSFSLTVSETRPEKKSVLHIYPGLTLKDTVNNKPFGQHRLYYFVVDYNLSSRQNITISLTPLSGKFNLYVANNPRNLVWWQNTFYYNWKGTFDSSNQENVIHIRTTDYYYRQKSTYLIMAQAYQFTRNGTATYSIVYSPDDNSINLIEDVPHSDMVNLGSYKFYTFPLHYRGEDIVISVTAASGDPNLYIAFDSYPTVSSYEIKSNNLGSEVLRIRWEEGPKKWCPDLPETYTHGDETQCPVYIAVYGLTSSQYSIKIHPFRQLPQYLVIGRRQVGVLNSTSYESYYTRVDASDLTVIDIQQDAGKTQLFINLIDQNSAGTDIINWEKPTKQHNNYKIDYNLLGSTLELDSSDKESKCPSGTCLVLITADCSTDYCGYSLLLVDNDIQIIHENFPKKGTVTSGSFAYYRYYCNSAENDMVVKLTYISGGDPDLYIVKSWVNSTYTLPDSQNYDWSSHQQGSDTLVISKDDKLLEEHSETIQGHYLIGVYSEQNSTFTIMVYNHLARLVKLAEGVPFSYRLPAYSAAYYYYYNFFDEDLVISLTPELGSALMTVKTMSQSNPENLYDDLPTLEDYTWASRESPDKGIIMINKTESAFCRFCDYVIGVFTNSTICDYNLVAKNDASMTVLQNGKIVKAYMPKTSSNFYGLIIQDRNDFDIVVTPYSSEISLFVTNKLNNSEGFEWFVERSRTVRHIRIFKSDKLFSVGSYLAQVLCISACSYSIMEHRKDTYIKLIDGWPISYSLSKVESDRVLFQYKTDPVVSSYLYCLVRPLVPHFTPSLYVNFEERVAMPLPGPYASELSFDYRDYDPFNRLNIALPYKGAGKYNIGVYSNYMGESEEVLPGEFEISCSSGVETKILSLGSDNIEALNAEESTMKFELSVEEQGTLEVFVVPCTSKLNMTVSTDWTVVDEREPNVKVQRLVDGKLRALIANTKIGKYFLTVNVNDLDSMYTDERFRVTSKFYGRGEAPQAYLVPGNEGIFYVDSSDEVIKFRWKGVEYSDQSSFDDSKTKYFVYLTENEKINMLTNCGIFHGVYELKEVWEIGNTVGNYEIKSELREGKYLANIIARVQNKDSELEFVVYDPVVFYTHHRSRRILMAILGIVGVVVVIAIGIALFFYRKYKRTDRRLKYEMNDVRNVAQVRTNEIEFQDISRFKAMNPSREEENTISST